MSIRETVYGIIFDDSQPSIRYLITRRVKDGSDYWQFFGGGIDDNEDIVSALEREIKEETKRDDYEIISELPFKSEGYKFQNDKFHKRVHFVLVRLDSSKPISLEEDHKEYKWGVKEEILETLQYEQQKNDFLKAVSMIKDYI